MITYQVNYWTRDHWENYELYSQYNDAINMARKLSELFGAVEIIVLKDGEILKRLHKLNEEMLT